MLNREMLIYLNKLIKQKQNKKQEKKNYNIYYTYIILYNKKEIVTIFFLYNNY